jgi:hypothetical protein
MFVGVEIVFIVHKTKVNERRKMECFEVKIFNILIFINSNFYPFYFCTILAF